MSRRKITASLELQTYSLKLCSTTSDLNTMFQLSANRARSVAVVLEFLAAFDFHKFTFTSSIYSFKSRLKRDA